jgi:hypothetical protein
MRSMLIGSVAIVVSLQAIILPAASPAVALSVDLAKKCREMAVKAHPPAPAGTTAYAQAERDFFRLCVAKNGDMQDNSAPKAPPPGPE